MLVGLGLAATFSVLALIRYLASPADFQQSLGVSFNKLIALYSLGGVIGGIAIAVLRPLRHSAWGSFFIGFVAGLPLAVAIMIFTTPRDQWLSEGLVFVVLAAILEGGGLAVYLQKTGTWK